MEPIIKVTPSELSAKASEFDTIRASIMTLIEEMKSKVTSLTGTWEGEESQLFQTKFAALNDDIEYLNAIIIEHVNDLNAVCQTYTQAGQSVSEVIEGLPIDIIK
ncbi:MAG: WXG100 family type VII secretion target [Clostridia bacterium]|nr:WXG100 family type VII secretion target [Clostridia bacterium]